MNKPYPELDRIVHWIGEAANRLSEIGACEGAAGNISVFLGWEVEPRPLFPEVETIDLPLPVPELAGAACVVSGSGTRLREILQHPKANLGCLVIDDGGRTGRLYTSPGRVFQRLTSEFNSHLAVHYDQVCVSGANFHAVVHAQPRHLTWLSHQPRYQDETYFNKHLLRWQPELIVQIPEGVGLVPFQVPGSTALMEATVTSMRRHHLVVWAKHGVVSRSQASVKQAADLIEYAETGAQYESLNLSAGDPVAGLTPDEIRAICASLGIQQNIF